MIHSMNLQDEPFEMIKEKTKTIELRLYDEKRKMIRPGDIIEFNNNHTKEILKAKVIALHIFENFEELYKRFDKISIGYRKCEKANPKDMEEYYPQEKIKKYGVVGIEIELIENKGRKKHA